MKQEFESYLRDNLMQYSEVAPYVYKIGDNTFELYKPDNDGALFDDDFRFTGLPMNPDRYNQRETTIDTSADYYAYKFGGCWYMLPRDDRNAVKLVRLKYLGTAVQEVQPTDFFLGVHGQYEILSGSGTYTDWCRKAKFLGVKALGICEKDTLAGVLKFQAECLTYGLKPIIGMECSVYDVVADYKFTVKIYVKNADGWQVMLSLNKEVNCINAKYVELERFKELVSGQYENLLLVLDPKTLDYAQCLRMGLKGLDIVYYQLDPVRYNDEKRDRSYLLNLKAFYADKELAPVMMCDAWYLDKEYSSVRDRLSSISGSNFYSSDDQYFKSNDQLFVDVLGILPHDEGKADAVIQEMEQSLEAMQGEIDSIDFTVETGKRHLPRYIMTPEESARYASNEDMFWGLIADGLEAHPELIRDYGEDVVMARIDTEVDVIKYGDTVDYFLITRDIINWCHQNGIMTGVSRGSAGGSLISYLLGITKLNPLEYGLLFERFLNKGRVQKSLPDIDTDYPGVDRPRVKKYMEERFGAVQVCSVGTFSALQLRAAIKDLSRVYGLEFQDVNEMMKLFSVDDRKPEDLFQIACSQPRVKKFVKAHSDLINEVLLVMPAPKAQSIHACATMIFPREHDMFHWVPVRRQGDEYVTEWEGGEMDAAGFLKNDILGVKQLDKFQDMVALIRQNRGEDVDIFNIPLDDPEVFRYFQNGWNEDNFHFGSQGLTGYCKQMRPQSITELIAAISLYRPGAMENGFHESYLKRRAGIEEMSYYVGTEDILKETYGIFCIAEDSDVLTERGLVKIQDIIPGTDRVKTEDGSFQTVYLKKDNGVRAVVEVQTSFGRPVLCTPNHKFLTRERGWQEAQNLRYNEEIVCYFEQPLRKDNLTERERLEHWLLGYFLAEGSCGSSPYFTVTNQEVAKRVSQIILELFPSMIVDIKVRKITHKSGRIGTTTRVCVKQKKCNNGYFNANHEPNQFIAWLKRWGVWGQNCYTKRLPKNYSLDMIVGLLEGDGCMKNYTLRLCNKELSMDVYMGLQSYGIQSSYKISKSGIPVVGWNDLNQEFNLRLFSHKKLVRQSTVHFGYGRIRSITPMGTRRVYDLSVNNVHSFVVNGCVVANCFQEQIMELCKKLGGLSLVEADDVRKAMVKKKYEALHKYHERFTPYYMEHFGVTHDYAESVWEAIDKASTYLFNKSHAAAYAITGYISQYMKVHYPIEYWSVAFKYATTDDYPRYIAEINKTGVCKVHPVDINISDTGVVIDFEHQALYWSIMGVKQVAERAAEQIIKERCENGQYWSLTDFISRHKWKGSAVNSRVIQNLILAGAFDAIENLQMPAARVELLQNFLQAAKIKSEDDDPVVAGARRHQGDSWWWHLLQKQVSGLAFFDYQQMYDDYFVPEQDKSFRDTFAFTMFEDCIDPENIPNAGQVFVGGYVSEVEYKKTKNGKMLCRVVLEQNYEFMELVIFDSDVDRLTQEIGELTALKGNIIFANVSVYYDKRKEANALRVNYDTHLTVFQL